MHQHSFATKLSHDKGYHWYSSICGHDVVKDKEEHTFVAKITKPTIESEGYTTHTCAICGYYYVDTITPMLHSYSDKWSSDNDSHWHQCTDEGYDNLKKDEAEHTYDDSVCTICNHIYTSYKLAFTLSEDGTAYSVTGIGSETNSIFAIPSSVNDIPVTKIGESSFGGDQVTRIILPDSILEIETYAFAGLSNLKSFNVPASVISIGEAIFYNCYNLTSIAVDSNNTIYDSRENCNAIIETASNKLVTTCKNTTITDTVKIIGKNAFLFSQFEDITLPDSITIIEEYAFNNCFNLKSVIIPETVT